MRKVFIKKKHWVIAVLFLLAVVSVGTYKTQVAMQNAERDGYFAEINDAREYASVDLVFQSLPPAAPVPGSVKIPIFIYHSVRPHIQGEDAEQEAYDITPELLESELKYLKNNGYTTISLDELELIVKGKDQGPEKPVILTFDDGWRNQYTYAFPLLKKYNDTATFYVFTNPIVNNLPHYFSWDELKEMDKAGMTIASHTLTHPYLSQLSLEALRKEVGVSKTILEANLGKSVKHFASPFGYTNMMIQGIIKDAGYETARTTLKGVYHSKDDLYTLTGILVDDSLKDFIKSLGN
jgi:peptidoglycan/xylan/chitin deacetylase (PgdA/CDA1 family)